MEESAAATEGNRGFPCPHHCHGYLRVSYTEVYISNTGIYIMECYLPYNNKNTLHNIGVTGVRVGHSAATGGLERPRQRHYEPSPQLPVRLTERTFPEPIPGGKRACRLQSL